MIAPARAPDGGGRPCGRTAARAGGPVPSGELLGRFPRRGPRDADIELRVVPGKFEGHPYLALHLCRRDPDVAWWPCKGKGVSIRLADAENIADAIREALNRVENRPDDPVATGRRAR